jgi:leucyl-tRNA synthetase
VRLFLFSDLRLQGGRKEIDPLPSTEFGKRNTIYSPKDGQPCMDHDRQSGEGVGPQEYVAMKLEVTQFGERAQKIKDVVGDKKVFLIAATLRSETMYGVNNLFVSPTIKYGVFPSSSTKGSNEEVLYIMTERAARNMAYQGFLRTEDKVEKLGEITGAELLGTKVHPALSSNKEVYVVPMDTIKDTKGTAIVNCMTSDSPDDHIMWLELRKKPEFYNIDPEWVQAESAAVINTPTYGDRTGPALIEQLKINSPKDTKQLAEAKELAYKEGFYSGTMIVEKWKGQKVEDVKNKIRDELVAEHLAFVYSEPESLIMSRSGDECVVALCDQWYLDYGQSGWLEKAELCVSFLPRSSSSPLLTHLSKQPPLPHEHLPVGDSQRLREDPRLAPSMGVRPFVRSRIEAPLGPPVPRRIPLRLDDLHGLLHHRPHAPRSSHRRIGRRSSRYHR